ncbi:MAG: type II toxin-antitoxin system prevent-host-death family antitoxin [Acidobacteriota bacterium]
MTIIAIESPRQLEELLDLVESGEDVAITRSGELVAKLVSVAPKKKPKRRPGTLKGLIKMSDDFDDELPMEDWMGPIDP